MPFPNESFLARCFNSVLFRLACGLTFLVVGLLIWFSTSIWPMNGLASIWLTIAAGFITYEVVETFRYIRAVVQPAPMGPMNYHAQDEEILTMTESFYKLLISAGVLVIGLMITLRLMVFGIYAAVGWATYTFLNSG